MTFKNKISELRARPYKERVRVLKFALVIVAIIIVGIWMITLRFRRQKESDLPSKFTPLIENLKQLKKLKP